MNKRTVSRRDFLRTAIVTSGAVLVSCTPATPPSVAPAENKEEQPTQAPASVENTKIMFWWHHGGAIGKAVEQVIKTFQEKNTNITIEGLQGGEGEKLEAALAGGVGPDSWDSGNTLQLAIRGAIQPMDKYLSTSSIKIDDYPQKPGLVWQGKVYAIPAVESGMENALVWNKKVFSDAGLDPEKAPTTPAELVEFNKQLTKLDGAGNITQLGFGPLDSSGAMFPNWPTAWGIKVFDENTNKINFTQPEAIELVQWLVEMEKMNDPAKTGAFYKTYPQWGSVVPGGAFSSGKEAMMVDGSWAPGGLKDTSPDGQFGYTWVPNKKGIKTQQMGAHQFGINVTSEGAKRDATWKFIEFIATEGNDIIFDATGSFAYSKPFATKVKTDKFPGLQWYFDSVAEAEFVMPRGYVPIGDAWGKWWGAVNDLIFDKASSIEDAMALAEKETQELLDQALGGAS
jgi:ABC-type glycerol-3-phosphate transport system substrate-binding protein